MKETIADKTHRGHTPIKLFGIMVLVFLMLVGIAGAQASENSTSKWVDGYYVGYDSSALQPEAIYWNGLTQIDMGAILANSDGSLNTSFYIDPIKGPLLAQQISNLAHQNHKKAILMLGGEDNGANISSAIENHRSLFINNLVTAMNNYGYDGIDLDWEDNVNYTHFASFAQALRKAAPNATLTVPVECINPNIQKVNSSIIELSKYVDQINLMSYYPGTMYNDSSWYSWFNSPLKGEKLNTPKSIENSLYLYNASGIPKNKLGMGISFFAVGYAGTPTITGPNQNIETSDYFVGGDNNYPLSKLFGIGGSYNQSYLNWSDEAIEPFLSLPSPDWSGARYISFEDPQSIIEKGNFTFDNGYGGIIVWTINQGYVSTRSDPNFLMEALQTGFIRPVAYVVSTNFHYQDWGLYPGIDLFGENYVPLCANTVPIWKSHVDKLAKLVLDSNQIYNLVGNAKLDLGSGYILTAKQVEVNSMKVWLELYHNGQYVDDAVVDASSSDRTWTSTQNVLGQQNVTVFKVHVKQVFQGAVNSVTQIDGIWLIDYANATTLQVGDQFGGYTLTQIISGVDSSNLGYLVFQKPFTYTLPPVVLVANFSSNVTGGYAPLTVKFTDLSKDAISWNWNFRDGTNSTMQNPMHTYLAPGTYTVNLTVKNESF